MALILNLETSTTVCSVSLAKDGCLLSFKDLNGDYSHAENLTLFIEDVLKQANFGLTDVDAIAVSKGPGSYTGLRIGVSTAKGLCYSLDKPLIAIDTLQYLSLTLSQKEENNNVLFCPMLDARRMEVYCAIYDRWNNCIKETSAEIIDEFSFADLLKIHKIIFFGDGAEKCKSVLLQNENSIFVDNVLTSGKSMVQLSEKAFLNKQFENVAYFEPLYLKDFIAGKKKQA